jgi:hypothetical protein
MTSVTHRQKHALGVLRYRHLQYPQYANFPASQLGTATTAMLRKLAPLGFVNVTRGGRGSRQFYSITERGVAQTVRHVGFTCFSCHEVIDFECPIGDEDDMAGYKGWMIGHWDGQGQYVCPNCTGAIWEAMPLGTEEGRKRFAASEVKPTSGASV